MLLVLWRVRDLNVDLRENVGESESTRWFFGGKLTEYRHCVQTLKFEKDTYRTWALFTWGRRDITVVSKHN
ncbi:hypothetical protein TSUD_262150 [Trifolium subterraneum]|nr:hypothetical protein TSUD_262150 [Trifolium subterraneum]